MSPFFRDKRFIVLAMYVLLPSFFGTITRLLNINPMIGDFLGVDLGGGLVSAFLLLTAFVAFCILFFLSVAAKSAGGSAEIKVKEERVRHLGWFVLVYQVASLAFTLQSGFGIAAGEGSVDSGFKIVFILLGSDYVFFAYYLLAPRSDRLARINSIVYLVYSILRGWASGLLVLGLLAYMKSPARVKFKHVVVTVLVLFSLIPFLLGIRELFRGDDTDVNLLSLLSSVAADIKYDDVLYSLVNRFDLVPSTQAFALYYKNMRSALEAGAICYPWNEGIYQTIFNALLHNEKCISAGESLPSLIHGAFFFDRRTSFSVGAGWLFQPDWIIRISYFLYLCLILFCARLFAGRLVRNRNIRAYIVFAIVLYVVPGWYFHFIQVINAILFVNIFLRLRIIDYSPSSAKGSFPAGFDKFDEPLQEARK